MFLVQQGKEQIQQLGREMIALRQEMRASVPPPPKWGQWGVSQQPVGELA